MSAKSAGYGLANSGLAVPPRLSSVPRKRGHSRFVEGIQIPPSVIQFLQGVRTARLQKEGGEYSAFLLVDDQNRQLTRQRLICLMSDGLVAAGIKDSAVSLHSAVHLLRHACANRWWALGVPLIDITHKLGHRSPDTTIRTYLHIAPFLQHEECSRIREPEIGFSKKGMTYLLGITLARLSQLERMLFSPLGKRTGWKRGKIYRSNIPSKLSVPPGVNERKIYNDHLARIGGMQLGDSAVTWRGMKIYPVDSAPVRTSVNQPDSSLLALCTLLAKQILGQWAKRSWFLQFKKSLSAKSCHIKL